MPLFGYHPVIDLIVVSYAGEKTRLEHLKFVDQGAEQHASVLLNTFGNSGRWMYQLD